MLHLAWSSVNCSTAIVLYLFTFYLLVSVAKTRQAAFIVCDHIYIYVYIHIHIYIYIYIYIQANVSKALWPACKLALWPALGFTSHQFPWLCGLHASWRCGLLWGIQANISQALRPACKLALWPALVIQPAFPRLCGLCESWRCGLLWHTNQHLPGSVACTQAGAVACFGIQPAFPRLCGLRASWRYGLLWNIPTCMLRMLLPRRHIASIRSTMRRCTLEGTVVFCFSIQMVPDGWYCGTKVNI